MGYTRWANDLGCEKIKRGIHIQGNNRIIITNNSRHFLPSFIHILPPDQPQVSKNLFTPTMLANNSPSFQPHRLQDHPPPLLIHLPLPIHNCLVQAERLIIIVILAFLLPTGRTCREVNLAGRGTRVITSSALQFPSPPCINEILGRNSTRFGQFSCPFSLPCWGERGKCLK